MAKKQRQIKKLVRIEVEGDTLQILDPIIASAEADFYFQNCYCRVREETSRRTDRYTLFNVFVIDRNELNPTQIPVGALTAQLLGSNRNRIILKALTGSRLALNCLSGVEKISLACHKGRYDEHFNQFVKGLEDRLKEDDLVVPPSKVTLRRKICHWIKSHRVFRTVGTALIIVITLLGTNWDTVVSNCIKCISFIRSVFEAI